MLNCPCEASGVALSEPDQVKRSPASDAPFKTYVPPSLLTVLKFRRSNVMGLISVRNTLGWARSWKETLPPWTLKWLMNSRDGLGFGSGFAPGEGGSARSLRFSVPSGL